MTLARHFHGWDTPALTAAVEILVRGWSGNGPLDLRSTRIVVPSRHAGRRLRAELARFADKKGSAVLSGAIVTPEHLLPLPPDTASDAEVLALLAHQLLERRQANALQALLPAAGTEWTFSFALGIAGQIQDVRRQLAEGDRSAADLIPLVSDDERERWADIAKLEKGFLNQLRKLGLKDPLEAMREMARRPPETISSIRVVSLFVPDYSPLAARALQALAAAGDVQLHLLAPESEADRFDAWGRPIPDRWEDQPLPIAESQIQVFEQAPDETGALAALLLEAERQGRALTVCAPDPGNARALVRRLQIEGRPLYLPNGVPLASTAPGRLLGAWLALLDRRDYAAAAAFLRHPDAQDWLVRQLGLGDAASLLAELDDCQNKHLPATFDDLLRFTKFAAPDSGLFRALEEIKGHFGDDWPVFLADLYDCRNPSPAAPDDPLFTEAAKALADLLSAVAEAARRLRLAPDESNALLRTALAREKIFPRPNSSVVRETTGWLEVQWETTPALLLADMREGLVPETRIGDAFLPDSLRVRAGLAGNRAAFARDLFLARALLESRPPGGVRFLYSRRAANQDPQLPSRLLMACPDDELPARVDLLFARPALRSARPSAPARPVLRLAPPPCTSAQIPPSLSVTAFKAYLDCPFRFYLGHVLGMRPQDDGARELDAMTFGTLAHDALRILAKHPALDDEGALQGLLLTELDRLAKKQFGNHPSLAVLVQLESLRQRLRAAAQVHAATVREGWRIVSAEEKYEAELETPDRSAKMLLRARIDRIDRHMDDGRIRILDYKTTDAGKSPDETHYKSRRTEWADLQLPLYRFLYAQLHPEVAISVGYFNLPKAATETRVVELDFRSKTGADLYPSALDAARAVVARIQAREFWPPERVNAAYDDFAPLLGADAALIEELRTP